MPMYFCPTCSERTFIGVEISFGGPKKCTRCSGVLQSENASISHGVAIDKQVRIDSDNASFFVGGNLLNEGKIDAHDTNFTIDGNVVNLGELKINDPEKIKQTLLEIARTTKDAAAIGRLVLEKIFGLKK